MNADLACDDSRLAFTWTITLRKNSQNVLQIAAGLGLSFLPGLEEELAAGEDCLWQRNLEQNGGLAVNITEQRSVLWQTCD